MKFLNFSLLNALTFMFVSAVESINVISGSNEKHFLSMIGNASLKHHPFLLEEIQDFMDAAAELGTTVTKENNDASLRRRLSKKGKSKKGKKNSKSLKVPKGSVRTSREPIKSTKGPVNAALNLDKKEPKTLEKPSVPVNTTITLDECDPSKVELMDFPQWEAEKGYWIGEYTFLKGDGNPFISSSWNYPYDHYRGFITGDVFGNAYRQRNVFLYPPQLSSLCDPSSESSTVGDGDCGVNGNTKVFQADQSATTCSRNEELGGDIEGPFVMGDFVLPTKTELVGKQNALVYQVFLPGFMLGKEENVLMQSQLTTITEGPDGQIYRSRTAQGFDAFVNPGVTTSASYYRERKVSKDEFYAALEETIEEYNVREEDMCIWDNNGLAIEGAVGSLTACKDHLEESFLLESE